MSVNGNLLEEMYDWLGVMQNQLEGGAIKPGTQAFNDMRTYSLLLTVRTGRIYEFCKELEQESRQKS